MNLHESQRKLLDEMASTEGSYVKDLELLKEVSLILRSFKAILSCRYKFICECICV